MRLWPLPIAYALIATVKCEYLMASVALSLVVATRGRVTPFQALFESLEAQSFRSFEVVVVDQNADLKAGLPAEEGWSFPITHLRAPTDKGLSRARNAGLSVASGAVILFPDDDCWYPPHFLAYAMARMDELGADVMAGRAADATGRDINGRFAKQVCPIDRGNVWITGIEWVVFFKRAVLETVGGYDPDIGVGATTPWQACEGQDIMLRTLKAGYVCWFDPSIFGHHAELDINEPAMIPKSRGYARGFGYVLRLHGFPRRDAVKWIVRPMLRGALSLLKGQRHLCVYFAGIALGRLEGWRMNVDLTQRSRGRAAPDAAIPTRP